MSTNDTELIDPAEILAGRRRTLAKAITLIESKADAHRARAQELLEQLLPHTGNSLRIGISGSPGVGKSTFIETFGQHLLAQGHRVAVLAVDPSSPIAGGSILGDKTRMETLSREANAFIRPSPSEGALGGVAQKTRESILLCEAAGFDVVLVETVGVGQSEFEVASMVDFFMVLLLPNAGDELQGIKKGIMELAHALVINKADGAALAHAQEAQAHYQSALNLLHRTGGWSPRVMTCSAVEGDNITEIWQMICDFQEQTDADGSLSVQRASQERGWMHKLVAEMLNQKLMAGEDIKSARDALEQQVTDGKITPFAAAQKLVAML